MTKIKEIFEWLKDHVVYRKVIIIGGMLVSMIGLGVAAFVTPHEASIRETQNGEPLSLANNDLSISKSKTIYDSKQNVLLVTFKDEGSEKTGITNYTDYNYKINFTSEKFDKSSKSEIVPLANNTMLLKISNLKPGWSYLNFEITSKTKQISTDTQDKPVISFNIVEKKGNQKTIKGSLNNEQLLKKSFADTIKNINKQITDQENIIKNSKVTSDKLEKENKALEDSMITMTQTQRDNANAKITTNNTQIGNEESVRTDAQAQIDELNLQIESLKNQQSFITSKTIPDYLKPFRINK